MRYKPDLNPERGQKGQAYDRIYPVVSVDFGDDTTDYYPSLNCPICGRRFGLTYTAYEIDDKLTAYESFWGYKAGSPLDTARLATNELRAAKGLSPIKRRKRLCWGELPKKPDYFIIHFVVPVYVPIQRFNQPIRYKTKPLASHRGLRVKRWDRDYWETSNYLTFGWDTTNKELIEQFKKRMQ